jgi:CDP-glycerol glycerophosphotransferase (TagB/SpsB family)
MELNENITISLEDSYQDLFRDSSILITDYSSVAFDFAYLKKPVIYYQPNDDYPYEKGYSVFEEMGLGDVILKEEDTVDKIKEYIDTGCLMENKYIERVNNFFKYTDKNNCKRVYEWILND